MKTKITFLLLINLFSYNAQKDSLPPLIQSYKEIFVGYTDFGYSSAPFSLNYPFILGIKEINFRNNFSPSLGLGLAYKWFSLRLNFNLKGTQKAVSRYGNTKALDLGINFQIKQAFYEFDLKVFQGYSIKKAFRWNDSLNELKPNEIHPTLGTFTLSLNAWIFQNKDWLMAAYYGKTAQFTRSCGSFFLKPTFSIYGVNNGAKGMIPPQLRKVEDSKTSALSMTTLDLGGIPGYAYVHRWKNFQLGGFIGVGLVIQAKGYELPDRTRGFLGLSPRNDIRFSVGYSKKSFFCFLIGEFENKSIRFGELKYKQTYYSLRASLGYRFHKEDKVKEHQARL